MKIRTIAGLAVVLLVAAAVLVLASPSRCRVTRENFDRIKAGMSRTDVETIFGGPAGDYTTCRSPWVIVLDNTSMREDVRDFWQGDEGLAQVSFSDRGVVTETTFDDGTAPGPFSRAEW